MENERVHFMLSSMCECGSAWHSGMPAYSFYILMVDSPACDNCGCEENGRLRGLASYTHARARSVKVLLSQSSTALTNKMHASEWLVSLPVHMLTAVALCTETNESELALRRVVALAYKGHGTGYKEVCRYSV